MPTIVSTKRAILHLAEMADTDILPPLFEFKFFEECSEAISVKVEQGNFGAWKPKSCFEVLSPKTRLSFRIAHQLYPTDTLLYTGAVLDIAKKIEEMRLPIENGPFSYRYVDDENQAQLYSSTGSYHDWLLYVQSLCTKSNPFEPSKIVLETDISDFYPRIYFHRIEHILDDCGAANSVRKIIEGIIKHSRAHQSHGLPVGSAASRLLAEALLNDTDRMIVAKGFPYARYVDDYRIFLDTENQAHSALCKIAEHLMLTEGLSLNAAKTKIISADEEHKHIEERLTDVFTTDEFSNVNTYFRMIYDGEDISAEDIDGISSEDLLNRLDDIRKRENIDYASVKVILKALRAVFIEKPLEILDQFSELLYYVPRDYCILIGTIAQKHPDQAAQISDKIIEIVTQQPFSDMSLSRLWVAHLFVTQALPITQIRLDNQVLERNVIEKRQRLLLRGILKDRPYFREQKTKFDEVSDWEKPALLLAMSCLSTSEYKTWLENIKAQYNDLLSDEYIRWLKTNSENLFDKLKFNFIFTTKMQEKIAQMFGPIDVDMNLDDFKKIEI